MRYNLIDKKTKETTATFEGTEAWREFTEILFNKYITKCGYLKDCRLRYKNNYTDKQTIRFIGKEFIYEFTDVPASVGHLQAHKLS